VFASAVAAFLRQCGVTLFQSGPRSLRVIASRQDWWLIFLLSRLATNEPRSDRRIGAASTAQVCVHHVLHRSEGRCPLGHGPARFEQVPAWHRYTELAPVADRVRIAGGCSVLTAAGGLVRTRTSFVRMALELAASTLYLEPGPGDLAEPVGPELEAPESSTTSGLAGGRARVVPVAYLPEDVRAKFTSSVRISRSQRRRLPRALERARQGQRLSLLEHFLSPAADRRCRLCPFARQAGLIRIATLRAGLPGVESRCPGRLLVPAGNERPRQIEACSSPETPSTVSPDPVHPGSRDNEVSLGRD